MSGAAEFVLVSPMLPNPRWPYPVMERFSAYRDALATLCGDGAALADVTRMWTDLLGRKSVHDLTGNGINHPNDFGHRVYAQVILALLVDEVGSVRPCLHHGVGL
jgi:acyl-CoA thioesterase I